MRKTFFAVALLALSITGAHAEQVIDGLWQGGQSSLGGCSLQATFEAHPAPSPIQFMILSEAGGSRVFVPSPGGIWRWPDGFILFQLWDAPQAMVSMSIAHWGNGYLVGRFNQHLPPNGRSAANWRPGHMLWRLIMPSGEVQETWIPLQPGNRAVRAYMRCTVVLGEPRSPRVPRIHPS